MLHGPKQSALTSIGLLNGKHREVTSEATIEDQTSQDMVLRWIALKISIDGENASQVTTLPMLITKVLISIPDKVWWAVFLG